MARRHSSRQQWGAAFLAQGRADLLSAQELLGPAHASVLAMLLQMGFEKFGKAFRCAFDEPFRPARLQTSHKGAAHMMVVLARHAQVFGAPIPETLRGGAESHLALVRKLEQLQPANAKKTAAETGQLEYPWKDPHGKVRWPAQHLPFLRELTDPRGVTYRPERAIKFASELGRQLEAWLSKRA